MPGFPVEVQESITPGVLHQLPELGQTHVHRVSDAIQPFHPLLAGEGEITRLSYMKNAEK